jgi:hypothetical protein
LIIAHRLNLGVELLCQSFHNAGSESAFRLCEYAIGFPDAIVGD